MGSIYADDRQTTHVLGHGERDMGMVRPGKWLFTFTLFPRLIGKHRWYNTITCVKLLYLMEIYSATQIGRLESSFIGMLRCRTPSAR